MSAIQLFDLNGQERFSGTAIGGGGAQLSVIVVPISFEDPAWAGDLFLIAELQPGDLLLDLWLTVTTGFQKAGPVIPQGNIYAGVAVADSGVQLFQDSLGFEVDANIPDGFAWMPLGAPPGGGARSLSGEAIRQASSKRVPITAVDAIQIGLFADDSYAPLDQGAGSFYALIATPS